MYTVLLWIAHLHIKIILSERPEWWKEFGLQLTFKLRLAFITVESTATLPATVRAAQGLINLSYGKIEILDVENLKQISDGDDFSV